MLDFLKSFFGVREHSGNTAKERLKLVLISDHLSLAPDVVHSLKVDLIEVISRYLDIDHEAADVTFEPRGNEIAMLANIPIRGVRDQTRRAAAQPPPVPQTPPPAVAVSFADLPEAIDARPAHVTSESDVSASPASAAGPAQSAAAASDDTTIASVPQPAAESQSPSAETIVQGVAAAEEPVLSVGGGGKRVRSGGVRTATIEDATR